jgi:hypothetical protein
MSFGKMFAGFGPAAGQAGMQAASMMKPPIPGKIPMDFLKGEVNQKLLSGINDSKPGLLGRLFGKMDKDKMRETGIGLINQAMQQQQGPQGPTIAPFQPGGGGGMPAGGGTPQLVALAQQLGLNRVL